LLPPDSAAAISPILASNSSAQDATPEAAPEVTPTTQEVLASPSASIRVWFHMAPPSARRWN